MTSREVYEGVLMETNKWASPNIQLDEINYYFNKGIYQWVNKRYNVYDTNQQTTDDLQVLKSVVKLVNTTNSTPIKLMPGNTYDLPSTTTSAPGTLTEAKYSISLPSNYYHVTNCILTYTLKKTYRIYNQGSKKKMQAKRITDDAYANLLNNYWLRPDWRAPYFIVSSNENKIKENWATEVSTITEAVKSRVISKVAGNENAHNSYTEGTNGTANKFDANDTLTGPTMILDYGKDNSVFELTEVEVRYIKVPARIRLTPEQVDSTDDNSQIMEFPDYVCNEIIKEIVTLILLHTDNPKLMYYPQVNQAIPQSGVQPVQMGNQQTQQAQ